MRDVQEMSSRSGPRKKVGRKPAAVGSYSSSNRASPAARRVVPLQLDVEQARERAQHQRDGHVARRALRGRLRREDAHVGEDAQLLQRRQQLAAALLTR